MPDFIPGKDDALLVWLKQLKTKIASHATTLGIPAARLTQITASCDALIAATETAFAKKAEWLAAVAAKDAQAEVSLGALRAEIKQWKVNPALTSAIATDLQIVGGASAFNPDTFQAEITVEVYAGFVRIKFKKGQTGGVNLYWRKKGETTWRFLARDTNSPYEDHNPLAVPGVPEVREYKAFGVVADEQIGQPSDIVSVTFGG